MSDACDLAPEVEGVEVVLERGRVTMTLTRPEAGNALGADQREALLVGLARANEDAAVRVVVLASTGRIFCGGADLRKTRALPPRPEGAPDKMVGDVRRIMLGGAIRLINAVLDCEKPVIAAVQGTAAGIGAHLALACDLVVASEEASFLEVFARRGLAVDGLGAWLLPRLVGLQRAKEMVLLAEPVPAARALELGLVTRVVPAAELAGVVDDLALRIGEGATRAHSVNKWLLNRSLDLDRHTMAEEEARVCDALSFTADSAEGVAAFVERRPAVFRGF
jgi:2-(1,2-epoxy-1,2-dihydrophenyl)acetyl-CoA isomerase